MKETYFTTKQSALLYIAAPSFTDIYVSLTYDEGLKVWKLVSRGRKE